MGLSRNKVAVSEGAAGSPPFYGESSQVEIPRDKFERETINSPSHKGLKKKYEYEWLKVRVNRCSIFRVRWNPEKAKEAIRGCSSVGRAPALQAGGQEFESLHLHHGWENQLGRTLNGLIAQQARALA